MVNLILAQVHPDTAALRRYLVDEGILDRERGEYWRSGGTFDPTPRRRDRYGAAMTDAPLVLLDRNVRAARDASSRSTSPTG